MTTLVKRTDQSIGTAVVATMTDGIQDRTTAMIDTSLAVTTTYAMIDDILGRVSATSTDVTKDPASATTVVAAPPMALTPYENEGSMTSAMTAGQTATKCDAIHIRSLGVTIVEKKTNLQIGAIASHEVLARSFRSVQTIARTRQVCPLLPARHVNHVNLRLYPRLHSHAIVTDYMGFLRTRK